EATTISTKMNRIFFMGTVLGPKVYAESAATRPRASSCDTTSPAPGRQSHFPRGWSHCPFWQSHCPFWQSHCPFWQSHCPFWQSHCPFWQSHCPFWQSHCPFWQSHCPSARFGCQLRFDGDHEVLVAGRRASRPGAELDPLDP